MSAEHLILAGIFAILFVIPLAWLFLIDRSRVIAGPLDSEARTEPVPGAAPSRAD
jgi:hypothetical protein